MKNERSEREGVEMEKMNRMRILSRGARKEDGEASKQSWRPGRTWMRRINGHWPGKKRCVMGPAWGLEAKRSSRGLGFCAASSRSTEPPAEAGDAHLQVALHRPHKEVEEDLSAARVKAGGRPRGEGEGEGRWRQHAQCRFTSSDETGSPTGVPSCTR